MRILSKRFSLPHANCPRPAPLAYFLLPATTKRQSMKREYHRWYSHRLGMELGVVVYGHWGPPLLGFPTSAGDEWELEGQSMVGALADFIDAGRIKFFTVNSINGHSFYDKSSHPFHRSYVQAVFDSDLDDGRFVRRVPRREQPLQAPRRHQALLRDVRRLRPAEFHGWHVRRQFLFQQSCRLPLECQRSLVLSANRELRHSPQHWYGSVGKQWAYLPPLRSSL